MPRPCAVESHARRYKESTHFLPLPDATALRRGVSRSPLHKEAADFLGCHGLAPWSLTLAATKKAHTFSLSQMPRPCAVESHAHRYTKKPLTSWDATALRRGVSRSPLQRKHTLSPSPRSHGLAPWSLTLTATQRSR